MEKTDFSVRRTRRSRFSRKRTSLHEEAGFEKKVFFQHEEAGLTENRIDLKKNFKIKFVPGVDYD